MRHDLEYFRKIQGMNNVESRKEAEIRLIKSNLAHDFYNSIDCESATVNGTSTDLLITRSTDYTIKKVVTKPDEHVHLGDIINWCDTDWIIDTIDADDRINTHAKMRRCNVVLKWLDENGVIRAYSGFCEDATKYGEGVEGGKIMQVPDFQIKVKIHLDEHSAKINRDRRFLLDASQYLPQTEPLGAHPSAYIVTRRNVLTGNHAGSGYVELTLNECAFSAQDNPTLMIADYYAPDDVYDLTISNADENLTVAKGAGYTLSCTAKKNGATLDQTSILFTSSNTAIATVSTAGKITGVANGTCVVTAKAGNVRKEIAVTVETASATASIKIFVDDPTIVYGQSKRVSFKAYQNGVEVSTTFGTSISSVTTVAEIASSGSGYVILRAVDNETLIGQEFTLTVSSVALSASAEQAFEIGGWF